MRIFWLFNHPAPYKVDLFNVLGRTSDLEVYFERASEGGRNSTFYAEKAKNFSAHLCHSLSWGPFNNYTHDPIKALKKNHYDVIVLNGWRTVTEQRTIAYCKRHHVPYVFAINGGLIPEKENHLYRKIKTHFISGAEAYLSPNKRSGQYLTHYGAEESRISYFPYSSVFESELLTRPLSFEEKEAKRRELGIVGKRVYCSAGQFIPRKNFPFLIQIWTKMPSDATLYLLGEGPLKEECQRQIDSLGLKNVFLLPYHPHKELFEFFKACDAFVFLSKEDIYGHVVNEALSQGLPVVSSPCASAAGNLLENGKDGFIVPLDDEEKIIEALLRFPDEAMSKGAIETARKNTIEISASFHQKFFEEYARGLKK